MNIEPTRTINGIDFTIFGNDDVKKYSAFGRSTNGVTIAECYDNQEPKKNGLIDPRMGTTNLNIICTTCGLNMQYCPGHFGHINLSSPVYYIGYFDYIKKILNCVCPRCSNLRINKPDSEIIKLLKNKSGVKRFDKMREIAKTVKVCSRPSSCCGNPLPKILKDANKAHAKLDLVIDYSSTTAKKIRTKLSVQECYTILRNISDEDYILMGMNPSKSRPENMICLIFPVPPVAVRPSIKVEGLSSMRDDDLTKQVASILKNNDKLLKIKDTTQRNSAQNIENSERMLQCVIATYYDNDSMNMPLSEHKGKPLGSLTTRLKSKDGRFRNNLMGKRVDYSGRSVITPDSCISIYEVGIPVHIAKILTYPERVSLYNIERLRECVKNSYNTYPGANYVIKQQGYRISLEFSKNPDIQLGDVVERHLIDGDVVLFNRQPSLHKYSMMCHHAKIINNLKYATFRLNIGVTTPYNADYDGDEMNITVPRSLQSKIELEELADVKRLLINSQTSLPLSGCRMDAIVGVYILTSRDDIKIPRTIVMNILSQLDLPKDKRKDILKIHEKDIYTGKELYSFIIPKKLNVNDDKINIKDGKLISGFLSAKYLSAGEASSLIRLVYDLYDSEEARKFFDNAQKIINHFNMWFGFTTSVEDITYSNEIYNKIQDLIKNTMLKVNLEVTEMENNPDLNTTETFETTIGQILNNVSSNVGALITNNFSKTNSISVIINSGSTGKVSAVTTSKNIAVESQLFSYDTTTLTEGRIKKMDGRRTLPYFCRDLETSAERGFNQRGYLQGLTFPEYVFNAIAGREGLIKIQLKTPESGYIQHKAGKTMEDFYIAYDGTVRNTSDSIIQFTCGDSNINTARQYSYTLNTILEDDEQIKKKYVFTDNELTKFKKYSNKDNSKLLEYIIKARTKMRISQLKTRIVTEGFNNMSKFLIPININKIKNSINNSINNESDLSPEYIISELEDFLEHNNSQIIPLNPRIDQSTSLKIKDEKIIKTVLKLALYETFAPKRCIIDYKLKKSIFDEIITDLKMDIKRNVNEPGEMVGIIASQSICENITQANLRSHHSSGVISKNAANAGVGRIIEIISNSKNIKAPSMRICFEKELQNDKRKIEQIKAYIKQTTLKEVRNNIEVYYDPNNDFSKTDNIGKAFYKKDVQSDSYVSNINHLPWVIRIKFNKEQLLFKNIELIDILSKFYEVWENRYDNIKRLQKELKQVYECIVKCGIASNNDNDLNPIVHIRFDMINYNINVIHNFIDMVIDKINIKGISNITDSNVYKCKIITFDNENHKINNLEEEQYIETTGINIDAVRNIKGISINRTTINNIRLIHSTYGIEAARAAIVDSLMTLTQEKIKYNHLSILIDYMTSSGAILTVDRNGLNKTVSSLLGKISFEKPIEQLITAATFNEHDEINGVSSRIMTGRTIRGGTGICNLLFNTDMVLESEFIDIVNEDEYVNHDNNELVNAIIANTDVDDIFIPM